MGNIELKRIKLTQNKYALVDDEDFNWLSQWKWCYDSSGYAKRASYSTGRHKTIYMHRELLEVEEGKEIDHINHNGLDNRRSNLRIVIPRQNKFNRKPNKEGASSYKGVFLYKYRKTKNPWVAQIQIDGQRKCLGYYATSYLASRAYNKAAEKYFGKYAYLNG